jgi:hypothetical protein
MISLAYGVTDGKVARAPATTGAWISSRLSGRLGRRAFGDNGSSG